MKAYQKPQMEVYAFSKEDVITTSGIITGALTPVTYSAPTQWKSEWEELSQIGE